KPDCAEHCNRFKYWLQDKKVGNGSLNDIVEAIAEKTQTWIPGDTRSLRHSKHPADGRQRSLFPPRPPSRESREAPSNRERIPFHPRKSVIRDETLAEFIRAGITETLTEVPGIGVATMKALAEGDEPIKTTHQLFGKFLALSPDEPDCEEHCNSFKFWLQDKNVGNGPLNSIVEAIAEKAQTWIPGKL
ncbi:unnamed protein product, partial [Ectocarpus sp. 12 AP-2014]